MFFLWWPGFVAKPTLRSAGRAKDEGLLRDTVFQTIQNCKRKVCGGDRLRIRGRGYQSVPLIFFTSLGLISPESSLGKRLSFMPRSPTGTPETAKCHDWILFACCLA